MSLGFEFNLGTRVVFGSGKAKDLPNYIKQLGGHKVFIVTDPPLAKTPLMDGIMGNLNRSSIDVKVFTGVEPNPPIEAVKEGAEIVKNEGCDVIIGVGGGSPVDTAKAIAFMCINKGSIADYWRRDQWSHPEDKPGLPCIAVPTTAGTSSEISSTAVIKDKQRKVKMGITHRFLYPTMALYDPELTLSLPAAITAATGMDALTHAIESYTNTVVSPLAADMALRAIELIGANLRLAVTNGQNLEAREAMLLSNIYAGLAMCNTRLALVHGITAVMGGYYNIPHGIVNAVLLPYVMEYNVVAAPKLHVDVACALGGHGWTKKLRDMPEIEGGNAAVKIVFDLMKDIGLPSHLSEIGIEKSAIPEICEAAMENQIVYLNPRKVSLGDMILVCERAFS